jgi:uncharacterized protein (TIGR03083 family)
MQYLTHCDHLGREGARFVQLAATASLDAPVPTCPEWSVSDLLAHLGFVHRRAQYWVKVRTTERLSPKIMNLSRGPVSAEWMAEGIEELVATLRASDPDDVMWAWGEDQHVRYWARRLLHETLVHRIDLEGALGVVSVVDNEVGADAIDEFFANVEYARDFSPNVKNLVGSAEVITFSCEEGPSWTVRLDPTGFEFLDEPVVVDARLSGATTEPLLVIYRRRSLEESSCVSEGRRDLVERWLANSALL